MVSVKVPTGHASQKRVAGSVMVPAGHRALVGVGVGVGVPVPVGVGVGVGVAVAVGVGVGVLES